MNKKPADIAEMTDAEMDGVAAGQFVDQLTLNFSRIEYDYSESREATRAADVSCTGGFGCRIFDTSIPYGD